MLTDVSSGLELRQDDAVMRALLADDLLQAGRSLGQFCFCGDAIGAARVAMFPGTTRCSLCVGSNTFAKRR